MISRYAILNEEKRDKFEKEYQMPYGYGNCEIFDDVDVAIDRFHFNYGEGWIIEEYNSNGRSTVYEYDKK